MCPEPAELHKCHQQSEGQHFPRLIPAGSSPDRSHLRTCTVTRAQAGESQVSALTLKLQQTVGMGTPASCKPLGSSEKAPGPVASMRLKPSPGLWIQGYRPQQPSRQVEADTSAFSDLSGIVNITNHPTSLTWLWR